MYEYHAAVVNVVDGDTIDVDVDLGFRIHQTMRVRLYGINTPELHGPAHTNGLATGLAAKHYVVDHVLNQQILLRTEKPHDDKYGRFLARVYYSPIRGPNFDCCLNDELIGVGLAVEYLP